MIVDASVALKWYVMEPLHAEAREVMAAAEDLAEPDIIVTEVANALRRKVEGGMATREQAIEALRDLPGCFSMIIPSSHTLRNAFDLALALHHPFPDCVYLACAVMTDARLVTDDRKFREKAIEHRNRIMLLSECKPRRLRGEFEG